MSKQWDQMLPEYQDDVNNKVRDLAPVAEAVKGEVGRLVQNSMISAFFD